MKKLKVLIIDDSVLYRKVLSDAFAKLPNVEVVGIAHNGKFGIEKIKLLKPDFITLDFNMPVMDGIATLKEIKKLNLNVKTVMVSSETSEGAKVTMEALENGAFDFIPKPNGSNYAENSSILAKNLIGIIRSLAISQTLTTRVLNRQTPSRPAISAKPAISAVTTIKSSSLLVKKPTRELNNL